MLDRLISLCLLLLAAIHLLPAAGVFGAARLAALYGVDVDDANLQILLRHRAVLFGLLGALLLVAAFRHDWQLPALLAGAVSVSTFQWLAWQSVAYNASISRVVLVDWVALAVVVVAGAGLMLRATRGA